MSIKSMLCIAAVLSIALALSAHAQTAPQTDDALGSDRKGMTEEPEEDARALPRPRRAAVNADRAGWGSLDADGDGRLSASEAASDARLKAGFAALDRNRDGYLSDVEYRAFKRDSAEDDNGGGAVDQRDD